MAIAKLVYYCPKCDGYFSESGNCPVCQSELGEKALINITELRLLIQKMATPEGVTKMLTRLKAWLEE